MKATTLLLAGAACTLPLLASAQACDICDTIELAPNACTPQWADQVIDCTGPSCNHKYAKDPREKCEVTGGGDGPEIPDVGNNGPNTTSTTTTPKLTPTGTRTPNNTNSSTTTTTTSSTATESGAAVAGKGVGFGTGAAAMVGLAGLVAVLL